MSIRKQTRAFGAESDTPSASSYMQSVMQVQGGMQWVG